MLKSQMGKEALNGAIVLGLVLIGLVVLRRLNSWTDVVFAVVLGLAYAGVDLVRRTHGHPWRRSGLPEASGRDT